MGQLFYGCHPILEMINEDATPQPLAIVSYVSCQDQAEILFSLI